ncbi:MAG: bifunctional YncE family protein/alkaline phosphatase family protein [Chryseolinea sp.]
MKSGFRALVVFALVASLLSRCASSNPHHSPYDSKTLYSEKAPFLMPYNRVIDGAGESVSFGDRDYENHSLDAVLTPDGNTLVVEDRYGLAFFDVKSHKLVSRWSYRDHSPHQRSMSTFSGLKAVSHNDSTYIFWGAGGGDKPNSHVMQVWWNGTQAKFMKSIPFEPLAPATIALPNEVVVSKENGDLILYVALNGNNQLVKVNVTTKQILWSVTTGMAPYGVTVVDNKAYVTNWAGPIPLVEDSLQTAGIPWGRAYVDPKTGAMAKGTVGIVDLQNGKVVKEINVGLHPNAIIASKDKRYVYVSNGNSDYISVIDAQKDVVSDSIYVGLLHTGREYIGSTPNGLALSDDGKILYVANGLDNAVCVVDLAQPPGTGKSVVKGYIPTEAYPSSIVLKNNELFVTNLEAIGARTLNPFETKNKKTEQAFNSHRQMASVSFIPMPNDAQLKEYTSKVKANSLQFRLALAEELPRDGVAPKPVPERIGEPSVFKHVLYIIKENRTYDQVLGDEPGGNGRPSLCIFGDSITPNQHQLSRDYMLLDNYYVSGKSSAEGHHWANAAMVTDYTEKSVRAWFRSYPHVLYDAMVYNKKGLLWNNALDHGKTVRVFGEACDFHYDDKQYDWQKLFALQQSGQTFPFHNTTTIARMRPYLSQEFPGGSDETVSDQMRADAFIKELNEIAAKPEDELPNLMIMALPNDHTSGMNPKFPIPRAMVADNDLAVGRIVEAVMKSKFAASTVIFITEDDSQAGWDHVSAYRTTGFVVSAYSRLKKTVHTNYNQTCMVRTIEQILGLPPMNVIDATATPMFDCFNSEPDVTFKYTAIPNRVKLNEMNTPPDKLKGKALNFTKQSQQYAFSIIDQGHDDLLNRIIWFSEKGNARYPARLAGGDEEEEEDED